MLMKRYCRQQESWWVFTAYTHFTVIHLFMFENNTHANTHTHTHTHKASCRTLTVRSGGLVNETLSAACVELCVCVCVCVCVGELHGLKTNTVDVTAGMNRQKTHSLENGC